jgi:ATP-dependent protease ClpP protease subunit
MQTKTLSLTGLINEKSFHDFSSAVGRLKKTGISTVFIHVKSRGGSVLYAREIAALIQSITEYITVIFVGHYVASSALIVFLSRGYRLGKKDVQFYFHNPFSDESHVSENEIEKTKETIITYISESLKLPRSEVISLMNENTYLTAPQALKIKLLHEIIPDTL